MTHEIVIYSRPECHLCHEMRSLVEQVAEGADVRIVEIDVDQSDELAQLYGEQVPVLWLNGRKIAKYRIRRDVLERALGPLGRSD